MNFVWTSCYPASGLVWWNPRFITENLRYTGRHSTGK